MLPDRFRHLPHIVWMVGTVVLLADASNASAQEKPPTPPPASAPSPPTTSATPPKHDPIKETVSDLFDRGIKAIDEQRWEDCRASFLAAWNIHRNYQVAGNLALCEAKLGRNAEATEHVTYFLRELPAKAPPERKTIGEALLKELRPKVAELSIRVNKSGAEVFLDGRSLGHAPLAASLFVEPGDRKVEARFGDATVRSTLSAKAGVTHEVALKLEETKSPQAWKPPIPLVVVSGGLALAGIGAGVGLTVAANGKAGETNQLGTKVGGSSACTEPPTAAAADCTALKGALRERSALSNAAVGAFVGGGVLALATGGFVLWRRSDGGSVQAAPTVGTTGAGVWIAGQW